MKIYTNRNSKLEICQYKLHNEWELEKWSRIKFGENRIIPSPVLEPTIENPSGSYVQIKSFEENWIVAIPGDYIGIQTFANSNEVKFFVFKEDEFEFMINGFEFKYEKFLYLKKTNLNL